MFPDTDPNDGTCRICDSTYTYNGISRHLRRCAADHNDPDAAGPWIYLRYKSFATASKPCWLHLLANPEAPLSRLDDHLRDAWYLSGDCTSRLIISNQTYARGPGEANPPSDEARDMSGPMKEILEPTPEFTQFYELGGGRLLLNGKVYEPLPPPEPPRRADPDADVHTLARNEPVAFDCSSCQASDAAYRCRGCFGRGFVCENCREDHPDDHRLIEVKNTPLMSTIG